MNGDEEQQQGLLRVGLVVRSFSQPRWIYWLIGRIAAGGSAQISVVMSAGRPPSSTLKRLMKLVCNALRDYSRWLYIVYMCTQRVTRRSRLDPLGKTDIRPLIKDVPVIPFGGLNNPDQTTGPIETWSLPSPSPDLLVWLNAPVDKSCFRSGLTSPPLGVWFFEHEEKTDSPLVPGFWEVVEGTSVTVLRIKRIVEGSDQEETVHESRLPTRLADDPYSVYANISRLLCAAAFAVSTKLREIRLEGLPNLRSFERGEEFKEDIPTTAPSNLRMIRVAAKRATHRAGCWVEEHTTYEQWFVAYKFPDRLNLAPGLVGFTKMLPPKDRFWADPFPLRVNGKYYIFLEEYVHRAKKGHISVVKLGSDGAWSEPLQIIERDYHLSYPFVFQWNSNYYMVPETGANGTVEIYKCISFPYEWRFERVLIPDIDAADPTLAEIDGIWWMFVATRPYDMIADDNYMELSVFFADTPLGPWKPHRRNPVKSDAGSSRPAGGLFRRNGNLYRPAQDCSVKYGYAVSINRLVTLTPTDFVEVEVAKILPEWSPGLTCCHTFNQCDDLTVVDGMRVVKRFR